MNLTELLDRAYSLGTLFNIPEPDRVHVEAPQQLPDELMALLREHKDELLEILSWPPHDANYLVARWRQLGSPEIWLSLGTYIADLERWLHPLYRQPPWKPEQIKEVRRFLLEHLPRDEAPEADPLLEAWRRCSIPPWQQKLREAIEDSREEDEQYARWMLTEILDLNGTEEQKE